MVWRGPMASKALMQMLQETLWPDLDYLVLDMPPGTGDIQLTLAQNIPVTGAVVVTHPQDIALIDAKRHCDVRESRGSGARYCREHEVCIFAVTVVTMSRFSVPVVQRNWPRNTTHAAAGADAVTHLLT